MKSSPGFGNCEWLNYVNFEFEMIGEECREEVAKDNLGSGGRK
jgi:hypothetical protein